MNAPRITNRYHFTPEEHALALRYVPSNESLRAYIGLALEAHRERRQGTVVDLGCGEGNNLSVVRVGTIDRYVGVDIDEEFIERAKTKHSAQAATSFVCADALHYLKKSASESVDAIITSWTLHNLHKDTRKQLYGESFRVLKPGGVFLNADKYFALNDATNVRNWDAQLFRYYVLLRDGHESLASRLIAHENEDMKAPYRMNEFTEKWRMRFAGFTNVKTIARFERDAVVVAHKPLSSIRHLIPPIPM